MGVKKVYSEPEFEIDRSVFESEKPISDGGWGDGGWGTWGTDFYDNTETVAGTMTDAESTDYRSSFDEGNVAGDDTFFEEWTLG